MVVSLLINDQEKSKAAKLLEFASKPENIYDADCPTFIPGERPEYVEMFGEIRCVFTITRSKSHAFRHISFSIPTRRTVPGTEIVCTLATWFGFTGGVISRDVCVGPGPDWVIGPDTDGIAVVLLQPLPN